MAEQKTAARIPSKPFESLLTFEFEGSSRLETAATSLPAMIVAASFLAAFLTERRSPKPGAPFDFLASRKHLPAAAKTFLEELVIALAQNFSGSRGQRTHSGLAGGRPLLNVLLVRALELRSGFKHVCVRPFSGTPEPLLAPVFSLAKN